MQNQNSVTYLPIDALMASKRFYVLVDEVNSKLKTVRAYTLQSNYQLLFLLAHGKGVNITPSRTALIDKYKLDNALVRELTNKALDNFKNSGLLVIDDRIAITSPLTGIHNLDAPSIYDRLISVENSLKGRK